MYSHLMFVSNVDTDTESKISFINAIFLNKSFIYILIGSPHLMLPLFLSKPTFLKNLFLIFVHGNRQSPADIALKFS
jgi:hypothetical protein